MRVALLLLVLLSACAGEGVDMRTLSVTSSFGDGGAIPKDYTCDGRNVSPPLGIGGLPEKTRSIAIIMDDPDAPGGTFVHWVAWNISPQGQIPENFKGASEGKTDFGRPGYGGPCPPAGGPHRYFFKVYALDSGLGITDANKKGLEAAMEGHVLARGQLIGRYGR